MRSPFHYCSNVGVFFFRVNFLINRLQTICNNFPKETNRFVALPDPNEDELFPSLTYYDNL